MLTSDYQIEVREPMAQQDTGTGNRERIRSRRQDINRYKSNYEEN